jgi:serine/threonine-protein kinase
MGDDEGQPYLAFEYVEGRSLAERLARGALPVPEAVVIVIALCDALGALHRHGLVHGDVKPANVRLDERGRPRLLDVGLSGWTQGSLDRAGAAADPLAAVAATRGTLEYLSPEQALGARGDARTDVFSLGVVLYEMLTGRRPFTGARPLDVLVSVLHDVPAPPSAHRPGISPDVDAVVLRALARPLDARFPDVTALGDALRAAALRPPDGEPTAASAAVRVKVERSALRRVLFGVALLAAAAGGLAWAYREDVATALARMVR